MEKKDEKLKIYINIEPLGLKFGCIFKKNETFQSIINFVFSQTKKIGIKFKLGRIIENKTGAILLTESQLGDFLENGDEITVYSEEYGFISNYLPGDNENNFSKRNFYHKNVSDLYKSLSFLKKKRNHKQNNLNKEIKEENYSSEKDEEENKKQEKKETNIDNKHKNQKQNNNKNKGNNKKYNNKKQKKDVTHKIFENNQKSDDDKTKDKLNKKHNEDKIDKKNEETIVTKNDNLKIIEQDKKQTLSDESSFE